MRLLGTYFHAGMKYDGLGVCQLGEDGRLWGEKGSQGDGTEGTRGLGKTWSGCAKSVARIFSVR